MSKIVLHMSMSVDGFITGPDDGVVSRCGRSRPSERDRQLPQADMTSCKLN